MFVSGFRLRQTKRVHAVGVVQFTFVEDISELALAGWMRCLKCSQTKHDPAK